MLKKLKNKLLGEQSYAESAADPEERQQLALAALLVEMSRADFEETDEEHAAVGQMLGQHFDLSTTEADALVQRAAGAMNESVSLFDFTRALHDSLEYEQKLVVIRLLWQVALVDNHLDKYEDYLLRKVGDLLYVSHSDIIKIRNEVKEANA